MSKRVVPDRQGYWIARTRLGNEIVLRVIGGDGTPAIYIAVSGRQYRVEEWNGTWLQSVPSAEAIQAATEALKAGNEYLRDECIPDEQTDALTAVNNKAIAGLSGAVIVPRPG